MLICSVAGMHRSGTSMITRLLNLCGMELGNRLVEPGADNPEGFWEYLEITQLNDEMLGLWGGSWDWPPDLPPGWTDDPRLEPLYARARELLKEFGEAPWWGWKDPRSSLVLPFWQKLLPNVKIIYSLRNPYEVSASIQKRGGYHTLNYGYKLWEIYNNVLLATVPPQNFIVTHYESYFLDPQAELQRLLDFLGAEVPAEKVAEACRSVATGLRHNRIKAGEIAMPVPVELAYQRMCQWAGPVYRRVLGEEEAVTGDKAGEQARFEADLALFRQEFEAHQRQLQREAITNQELTASLEELRQYQGNLLAENEALTQANKALSQQIKEVQEWALDLERRLQQTNRKPLDRLAGQFRKVK